jgi:hypothetical protein
LCSIGHQGGGVGVNDGTVEHIKATEEFTAQFVVSRLQAAQGLGAETQQKSSQCIAMGKIVQTQKRWNQSVVEQALSVFDASQADHNGKDMGQKQVSGMKVAVVVIGPADIGLEKPTNCKTPTKGLEKTEATKAGQAATFKGKSEFPGSFWHPAQSYLKGSFVQRPNIIDKTLYSSAFSAVHGGMNRRFSGILNF